MKLLLLTIGLCMANAFTPDTQVSAYPDFKPEQINGVWFSIAVVSNRREEIIPGGKNRFQIYSFQTKENGNIHTITYSNWSDVCQQVNITLIETTIPGQYQVNDLDDNYFVMEDTDYENFLIVYCQMGKNSGLWQLFGRNPNMPRMYEVIFESKVSSRGFPKKDISYFSEKVTVDRQLGGIVDRVTGLESAFGHLRPFRHHSRWRL
ncbi:beta-lactoglobulin [Trichosurus vulpecula]|uniref:beta-lactoglobulin n=1 Tax=Trichosurus vulpecula TaxID=9337 RepID=UPI00186B0650|nr:beta-lactoglobulin [Trichosurus vulpecula]